MATRNFKKTGGAKKYIPKPVAKPVETTDNSEIVLNSGAESSFVEAEVPYTEIPQAASSGDIIPEPKSVTISEDTKTATSTNNFNMAALLERAKQLKKISGDNDAKSSFSSQPVIINPIGSSSVMTNQSARPSQSAAAPTSVVIPLTVDPPGSKQDTKEPSFVASPAITRNPQPVAATGVPAGNEKLMQMLALLKQNQEKNK